MLEFLLAQNYNGYFSSALFLSVAIRIASAKGQNVSAETFQRNNQTLDL